LREQYVEGKKKSGMATSRQHLPFDRRNLLEKQQNQPLGEKIDQRRVSTGITGLDEVLYGGLIPKRTYLVRGRPGSGKTTLGLHFLIEGAAKGESVLLITFGEAEAEIRANAQILGFDLAQVHFLDLSPNAKFFTEVQTYDIFSPAEVEREPVTKQILDQIETLHPQRVFLDAMTQFRYLTTDAFQFRKQVLSFQRFLIEQGATVLFTSEGSISFPDDDLQFMSDGIINLESYPKKGRAISVSKFHGSNSRSGNHTMCLTDQGMQVYPRLLPEQHTQPFVQEQIAFGVPELDELLHGGLERGTITLVTGPTGVGKTTLGLQFMKEAAGRGERSVVYTFEESQETILLRCEALNIPVRAMLQRGTLSMVQVEPLHLSPDEFACMVRTEIEQRHASVIMIDGIAGYRVSLHGSEILVHLHALCKYLQNMGVAVLLVNEMPSIVGDLRVSEIGISYLADNIIFLRYLELQGEIRKVIGVLKKRLSSFERGLREIEMSRYGIKVGQPLKHLQGILTGNLSFIEPDSKKEYL
jgi:circadian clock protein KaiC